jgi:hypothetical protein
MEKLNDGQLMYEKEFKTDMVFENKKVYVLRDIKDIVSRSIGHRPNLEQAMFEIVSSKLHGLRVSLDPEPSSEKVICLVPKDQATVTNLHDRGSVDIYFGDIVIVSGDTPIDVSGNCLLFDFYVSSEQIVFGDGSLKFEVTALINDKYTVVVNADSPEEAISIANEIPINSWLHPTIEPGLKERRIVRYARWGNLSATEVH